MVRIPGVEKFADRFSQDHAKFVVIGGGTAREFIYEDAYYGLISSGAAATEKYGMPTLRHEYLPLFKMRAYIDLMQDRLC